MNKKYNKSNFHKHTFCVWNEVAFDAIKELEINFKSDSGSQYIFTAQGVYRISNHWGRAANCRWRLDAKPGYKSQHSKIGFAHWSDFYPNDDGSKLFFIKVNFATNEVLFYHKDSKVIRDGAVLRNAGETAKRIITIKKVLMETDWSRYLQYDDLEVLRKEIIYELINTEQTFIVIKQKHHRN